jgi:hypothetical protein
VAVLWAYRNKRKQHRIVQKQPSVPLGNAAAKVKADMIERRLLLFAVISFFGHALFSVYMVGKLLNYYSYSIFIVYIFF